MTASASNDLSDFRSALRNRLIAAREALPAAEHARLSREIERHLQPLLEALKPAVLAFCWPFRGEFDARLLVSERRPGGLRACLPVVRDNASPLEFREWAPHSEMIEDRYGIHIPARGAAMRFLTSRAYDWLNPPAGALVTRKDPLAFARRRG